MATNPKHQDPTEAALSAIEAALSLDADMATASAETDASKSESKRVDAPKDAPAATKAREPDTAKAKLAPSSPANDDRRSVGQILQALQYHPSPRPYVIAAVLSAA